jgi:pilus assembly protein CpaB
MNKNVIIVLAGAVLVAVLVAAMVQVMMGGKEEPVVQEEKINVLVAAKDLKIGQELKSGDLRWQPWPKTSLFPGAVRQLDDQAAKDALEGRLARDISKGEPVMKSAILGKSAGNFVAASLEPGMRAISIDVKAAGMVSGFIGPGDHVDVILTYGLRVRSEEEDPNIDQMLALNLEKSATETILQNVKVLAVDQSAERAKEDKIKVGKTVTLAVGIQDAERLALASGMGSLSLVLRGVGDDAVFEKKWDTVSDARLTSMRKELYSEVERIKAEGGGNSDVIRVYSGGAVNSVSTR